MRRATIIRERETLDKLAMRLARRQLMLSGYDPEQYIEWRATGERDASGAPMYVGSKTRLEKASYEQLVRLWEAIENLREDGWKIQAPPPKEDLLDE